MLTLLQINGAGNDPVTRNGALLSLICALMSLLYGCLYSILFRTMRKPSRAAEWAAEWAAVRRVFSNYGIFIQVGLIASSTHKHIYLVECMDTACPASNMACLVFF